MKHYFDKSTIRPTDPDSGHLDRAMLCRALNALTGWASVRILNYILANISPYNNLLLIGQEDLAAATCTTTPTICKTLNSLREADIIAMGSRIIMVNPKLYCSDKITDEELEYIEKTYRDLRERKAA